MSKTLLYSIICPKHFEKLSVSSACIWNIYVLDYRFYFSICSIFLHFTSQFFLPFLHWFFSSVFFFGLDDFFCVCVLHTSSICYDRIDLSQQKNSIFYDLIFVFEVIDFGLISVLVKYYLVDFSSQNDLVSFVFFFFFVYRN